MAVNTRRRGELPGLARRLAHLPRLLMASLIDAWWVARRHGKLLDADAARYDATPPGELAFLVRGLSPFAFQVELNHWKAGLSDRLQD